MLTNAHTHLELTALARLCPREPTELLSWLGKVLWARWWTSERKIRKGIERGIADLESLWDHFPGGYLFHRPEFGTPFPEQSEGIYLPGGAGLE